MAHDVYEMIPYDKTNFKFSMVSIDYGPLHLHKEMELCLMLYGNCVEECMGHELQFAVGDFWIINSDKSHQTASASVDNRLILLELQISPEFFESYFPEMNMTEFSFCKINRETFGEDFYRRLATDFLAAAELFFRKTPYYELKTAGLINQIFFELLSAIPHETRTKEERLSERQKALRLRSAIDYIHDHCAEPLYLTDLAEREALSMSRLSHAFKESFGISFQEYLAQVRSEKAAELLKESDMKLIDVCIECGFSDAKYFNRDFRKYYHTTPKEYRNHYRKLRAEAAEHGLDLAKSNSGSAHFFENAVLSDRQNLFGEHTVFFLPEDAIVVLEYCDEENILGIS